MDGAAKFTEHAKSAHRDARRPAHRHNDLDLAIALRAACDRDSVARPDCRTPLKAGMAEWRYSRELDDVSIPDRLRRAPSPDRFFRGTDDSERVGGVLKRRERRGGARYHALEEMGELVVEAVHVV